MIQVSLPALQAMMRQDTDEVPLRRLTIDHASLVTPIRIVNDSVPMIVGSDTARDRTANGHEAPLTGDPEWAEGIIFGSAGLKILNAGQYASGGPIQLGNDWTMEAACRPETIGDAAHSVLSLLRPWISITNSGEVQLVWRDSGGVDRTLTSDPSLIEAGKPLHLAAVHAGTTTVVYANGVIVAIDVNHDSEAVNDDFYIGNHTDGLQPLGGVIDEVRFWNIARSTQQIHDNMLQFVRPDEPGLVAYFRLDDGAFIPCPFNIKLPDQEEGKMPEVRLQVDNVDAVLVEALDKLPSPATVTVEVVMASSPTVIEYGPATMNLKRADADSTNVEGTLGYQHSGQERYPHDVFTPTNSPALF